MSIDDAPSSLVDPPCTFVPRAQRLLSYWLLLPYALVWCGLLAYLIWDTLQPTPEWVEIPDGPATDTELAFFLMTFGAPLAILIRYFLPHYIALAAWVALRGAPDSSVERQALLLRRLVRPLLKGAALMGVLGIVWIVPGDAGFWPNGWRSPTYGAIAWAIGLHTAWKVAVTTLRVRSG